MEMFKVGDRVQWVGEYGGTGWDDNWGQPGDVGTVVRDARSSIEVRVDRSGKEWSWMPENTAKLVESPTGTVKG